MKIVIALAIFGRFWASTFRKIRQTIQAAAEYAFALLAQHQAKEEKAR